MQRASRVLPLDRIPASRWRESRLVRSVCGRRVVAVVSKLGIKVSQSLLFVVIILAGLLVLHGPV